MSAGKHCEIERKYLIRYPDAALLTAQPGCETWDITQIYLRPGPGGETRRIRRVETGRQVKYFRASKRRVSDLSAIEDEAEITGDEYDALRRQRDLGRSPIVKTRYRVPYHGHTLEFDIYPFWQDRAILEIELDSEDEAADIPGYVNVMWDVTGEAAYKNWQLAKRVPEDIIPE
ncbi:MAG: hypothetical protein IJ646_11660 [Clostridia bacterium]|nr:hypothetical protein [Clostridia bacterium]